MDPPNANLWEFLVRNKVKKCNDSSLKAVFFTGMARGRSPWHQRWFTKTPESGAILTQQFAELVAAKILAK